MALREENFAVLHSGSWNTKAGINVVDTNKPPNMTIRTLVGSRTVVPESETATEAESTTIKVEEGTAAETTTTTTTATEDAEIPDINPEKAEQEGETASETQERQQQQQENEQESNKPQVVYYSGSALTEAMQQYPEGEITLSTPIQDELGIKRSRNASPVLMVVPTAWTKEEHEQITQIFFENFNVPGLYLAEEPLMTLYGCAAVTGLVIDIGHNSTEITPILDTQIQRNAIQTIPLAGADFDAYFLGLLKADAQLVREYGEPLDLEFARHLKESNICQVLTKDEKESKNRVQAEYNGKKFTVGSARYKATEPLFNPDLVGKRVLNIIETIHAAQFGCKAEKRQSLWESIIVTGGSCQIKGLQARIQSEIEESLAVSENFGEFQVREVKFLKIPDYFPALKDSIVHAGFLGSEIVAKLIFPDPRNYINKVDYNESGPSVVHTKTF
ncbi:general RNA polymerase II transcription factor [Mortierella polycephala]|uniref:General RNA polymerase II transcription factor n=1 Tax=Mortierella polycephala TaxID=41804 RepID=A0A9P6PP71_9FUNG|nr:general RNA polymerase II transcription factor [Mortierella polycephala]